MAHSFVGKPISLISHSDVRYRGLLAGVDTQNSTIQLSNVFSLGTESRRPPHEFIPPVQDPYDYIIFRASEVKDLALDELPAVRPVRNVHDDPAVLGASRAQAPVYPTGAGVQQQGRSPQPGVAQVQQAPQQQQQARRTAQGSLHTAAASLETVERALGDLRVTPSGTEPTANSIQRRHQQQQQHTTRRAEPISVPTTDFDFQSSNARFNKQALKSGENSRAASADGRNGHGNGGGAANGDGDDEESEEEGEVGEDGKPVSKERKKKEEEDPAYNPKRSFFDTLSPGPQTGPSRGGGGGGRGGRGRGRGGRNRREEEREKNVATFGEPGGVGLLGPGAYVGGWGGYGRRGGRARRGGGAPAAPTANGAAR